MQDNQLRVLVVDDDEDDIFLVKELLKEGLPEWNITLDYATTSEDAILLIKKYKHDVGVLDLHLGKVDGLSLLKYFNEKDEFTPVIFLTAQGDQEKAVEVMKAGATDYLIKSRLSVEGLARSIRSAVKLAEEKTQRVLAEHSLKVQDELLQGVSKATHKLLTITDFHSAINQALEELGKAANIEGAFIFKNIQKTGSAPICNLAFSWVSNTKTTDYNYKTENLTYADLGISENLKPLNNNHSVIFYEIQNSDFPDGIFKQLKFNSLLLICLEIDSICWGFVALGAENINRIWSKNEQSILEAVVANIGGEIKRQIEK